MFEYEDGSPADGDEEVICYCGSACLPCGHCPGNRSPECDGCRSFYEEDD